MRGLYILDENNNPIPATSLREWGDFNRAGRYRVGLALYSGVEISTVFLGIDQSFGIGPRRLFETAIISAENVDLIDRYATWAEALAGHEKAVAFYKQNKR